MAARLRPVRDRCREFGKHVHRAGYLSTRCPTAGCLSTAAGSGYARPRQNGADGAPSRRPCSADFDGLSPRPDRAKDRLLANSTNPRPTEERSGIAKKWTTTPARRKAHHVLDTPRVDRYTARHAARVDIFSGVPTTAAAPTPAALDRRAGPLGAVPACRDGRSRDLAASDRTEGGGAHDPRRRLVVAGTPGR